MHEKFGFLSDKISMENMDWILLDQFMMRKCCAFVKKSETIAFVWNHKNMKVKIVV